MDNLWTTEACTLPTAERPLRLAEFDALFAQNVRGVERDGDTVRLRLSGEAGLLERARDLAERETACCSFFTFLIEGVDCDASMEVSVPPEHRDILNALAHRAVELSS